VATFRGACPVHSVISMRSISAFWRVPYGADTWRRFGYAVATPPLAIASLALVLAGRADTAARHQRRLASSLVGLPASEPRTRPTDRKVIGMSAIVMAVGLACWLRWRFTFTLVALPLTVNCVALALAGRAPAVARFQRRLAGRLAGGSGHRRMGTRVAVQSIAGLAVGLAAWMLLAYLPIFTLGNLAFPLVNFVGDAPAYGGPPLPWDLWRYVRISYDGGIWTSTYPTSNGGPTLAGAWAYHAAQFVVALFPLGAWAIRGLTRLHAWQTQALLGGPASSSETVLAGCLAGQ